MKRTMLILSISVLAVVILASVQLAEAQQEVKVYRIGVQAPGSPSATERAYSAFWQGLRELGYIEGENILVEYRYAAGPLFSKCPIETKGESGKRQGRRYGWLCKF